MCSIIFCLENRARLTRSASWKDIIKSTSIWESQEPGSAAVVWGDISRTSWQIQLQVIYFYIFLVHLNLIWCCQISSTIFVCSLGQSSLEDLGSVQVIKKNLDIWPTKSTSRHAKNSLSDGAVTGTSRRLSSVFVHVFVFFFAATIFVSVDWTKHLNFGLYLCTCQGVLVNVTWNFKPHKVVLSEKCVLVCQSQGSYSAISIDMFSANSYLMLFAPT